MDQLREAITAELGVDVAAMDHVGGGDVAEAFRVTLADDTVVFAKTHRSPPPNFFVTEATGLRWLAVEGGAHVPDVLAVRAANPALLVLEWVDVGTPGGSNGEFGRQLAALHRAGADCFGRTDRATTGSLGLPNDPCGTWVEFYADRRLRPLRDIATGRRSLNETTITDLDRVIDHLDQFAGPDEPPARLHGDLWAGNRIVDSSGNSWLIDPAAHGGHREFDLAMMRLFGGFTADEFDAYHEVFPLAPGWQRRVGLHQLAPLIVHAIKFGGSYRSAVQRTLTDLLSER